MEELRTKQNIEILEFPAEVLAELRRVASNVLEQEASESPEFKRVYENYLQFREEYAKWTEISDDSYEKSLRD